MRSLAGPTELDALVQATSNEIAQLEVTLLETLSVQALSAEKTCAFAAAWMPYGMVLQSLLSRQISETAMTRARKGRRVAFLKRPSASS